MSNFYFCYLVFTRYTHAEHEKDFGCKVSKEKWVENQISMPILSDNLKNFSGWAKKNLPETSFLYFQPHLFTGSFLKLGRCLLISPPTVNCYSNPQRQQEIGQGRHSSVTSCL